MNSVAVGISFDSSFSSRVHAKGVVLCERTRFCLQRRSDSQSFFITVVVLVRLGPLGTM